MDLCDISRRHCRHVSDKKGFNQITGLQQVHSRVRYGPGQDDEDRGDYRSPRVWLERGTLISNSATAGILSPPGPPVCYGFLTVWTLNKPLLYRSPTKLNKWLR